LSTFKVNVYANQKTGVFPFSIDGEFPTFISKINDNDQVKCAGLRVGDFLVEINGRNVSRASSKSVRKILKGSTKAQMIVYRPSKMRSDKAPANDRVSERRNYLSCFVKAIRTKTTRLTYKLHTQADTDSDLGYYSNPNASFEQKPTTRQSEDDVSSLDGKSFDDMLHAHAVLDGLRTTIGDFLISIESLIEVYVRPTIALDLLSKHEYLDLSQNVEKVSFAFAWQILFPQV
jgi:hypothetical protein